jgi:hypothetical protein
MAKRGAEYEQFVYDKFRRLFADATVTLNDKIRGTQSDQLREIDVSIRIPVEPDPLLYIVQCKDRASRPADLIILGEFSSVIKDVGAAKGFLVCTSGFAKSNHQYARVLGIELVTVEDINSERWKAYVQIPLVYVRNHVIYNLDAVIIANKELVEKNRDTPLEVRLDMSTAVTFDGGATSATLQEYLGTLLNDPSAAVSNGAPLDLLRPGLRIGIADVWTQCSRFLVRLIVRKNTYLKYLTPDEYSQIRDHVRNETLPLHVVISGTYPILDDTFVAVPDNEPPVFAGLFAQVEEWTDQGLINRLGPE